MKEWMDGYKVVDTKDYGKTLISSSAIHDLCVTYHKNKKHLVAKRNHEKDGPLFLYKTLTDAKIYCEWLKNYGDLRIYKCKYVSSDEKISLPAFQNWFRTDRIVFADQIQLVGRQIKWK